MPFALLIIGVVLLISGVRNTQDTLFATVKGDFTGSNNFIYWFVAILIIGAVGYIPKLKPVSNAFLALVIIVLFLKKGNASGVGGGFFQQFSSALGSTTQSFSTPTAANLQNLASQNAVNLSALQTSLANNLAQTEADLEQHGTQLLQPLTGTP